MFISFEGIDGSGKSTQAKLLAAALEKLGHNPVLTREPGGSEGGEEIRRLLVSGDTERWSPMTELLLFNAARRDHLEKRIMPALEAGKIVISDRFHDSTLVYQGVGRAGMKAVAQQMHDMVIGRKPDLTLIIDADSENALRRGLERKSGEDRFEAFGLDFQKKLRAGFRDLASAEPQRVKIINGDQTPDAVHRDVMVMVLEVLNG